MMDTDLVLTEFRHRFETIPRFATIVFGERKREFSEVVSGPESIKIFIIRSEQNEWRRRHRRTSVSRPGSGNGSKKRRKSTTNHPIRFVVELVMEALERREWPRTEAEIHLLRSSMFTAQAIIRDMEKAGREKEIEQISRDLSEVAPELPSKTVKMLRDRVDL